MGHLHELFDFTISALIVFEQKVLLIHHKKLNMWLQPGGHIELDEDPMTALWRELYEETGYTAEDVSIIEPNEHSIPKAMSTQNLSPPMWLNIHGYGKTAHKHIDMRYVLVAHHDKVELEASAHNDIQWFTLEEMQQQEVEPDLLECAQIAITMANLKKDDA